MMQNEKEKKDFWTGVKHAFAIEKKGDYKYTEEDLKIFDKVALKIKKFGMVTPAILFLESVKPLSYVGSQTMVFFQPIIKTIFKGRDYDRFSRLLEHRSSINELIKRIERDENEKPREH